VIQILKHFLLAKWRWATLCDKQALEHYQHQRIKTMIQFAAKHSSFYCHHWQGYDLNDWQHLPLVYKSLMMNAFDHFNTVGIQRKEALKVAMQAEQERNFSSTLNGYTVGLSSGTVGERGLFIVSQSEQDMWTGVILARALHQLKRERIAFFLRSNSNLYENVGRGGWLEFSYFDLREDIQSVLQKLNQFSPTILLAPPSMLERLALKKEAGYLKIQPKRLLSVAEVLEPQDKERLERVFNAPVHQIYQATEGLLAISCKHGSLHIQEDLVKLEFETLEDEYVTPIITDLWRTTQPMIRYRLGDVLRLESQPCPCGHPWTVIRQIEGRESDVLEFMGKRVFPDQMRKVILQTSGVKDYVVQQSGDDLQIYLLVDAYFENVASKVKSDIAAFLKTRGINPQNIEVIQGLLPRDPNIKRRRFIGK
jgi:putative adenylate-forming enzyme